MNLTDVLMRPASGSLGNLAFPFQGVWPRATTQWKVAEAIEPGGTNGSLGENTDCGRCSHTAGEWEGALVASVGR
jgi:hypothetical protein